MPVRVRNLSPGGALLEAEGLPAAGSSVILRRGQLTIGGKVVRAALGKAGIEFDQTVHVPSWMPLKGSPALRSVDQFAAAVTIDYGLTEPARSSAGEKLSSADILNELRELQSGLISLGEKLSNDCIVVATHPEIQFLDHAVQRIAKLVDAAQFKAA